MKLRLTFDFTAEQREAIAAHYNYPGCANRETLVQFVRGTVYAETEDTVNQHKRSCWLKNHEDQEREVNSP